MLLAYLIQEGLNEYAQVAATAQAYINDPETILALVANDRLEEALEDLRGMESVIIDVDPDKEEMVPRPDPTEQVFAETEAILEAAREEDGVLTEYEGVTPDSLAAALSPDAADDDIVAERRGLDAEALEAAIERVAGDPADGFGEFEPASAKADDEVADGGTPKDSAADASDGPPADGSWSASGGPSDGEGGTE